MANSWQIQPFPFVLRFNIVWETPIKLLSFLLGPLLGSDWNKGIHQANSVTKPNKPQSGIVY